MIQKRTGKTRVAGRRGERQSYDKRCHRKLDAIWQHGHWSLTMKLVVMGFVLVLSVVVGLLWDFRSSGFILAALLIGLAGVRFTGRNGVFSSRSRKFDVTAMAGMAVLLIIFSFIAPA